MFDNESFKRFISFLPEELRSTWVLQVFIVILVSLLIAFVARLVLKKISKKKDPISDLEKEFIRRAMQKKLKRYPLNYSW